MSRHKAQHVEKRGLEIRRFKMIRKLLVTSIAAATALAAVPEAFNICLSRCFNVHIAATKNCCIDCLIR